MEPFFFPAPDNPLYGVYHSPQDNVAAAHGVLICPPAGQEHMRLHRALRVLADLLSRAGHHVLRFDFPGLGDSLGDAESLNARHWQNSIASARKELEMLTGVQDFAIVAARLGANIAATAPLEKSIRKMVLWDPNLSASSYADEMRLAIRQAYEPRSNFELEDGSLQFNGFLFPQPFLSELETLRIDPARHWPAEQTLLIGGRKNRDLQAIHSLLKANKIDSELQDNFSTLDWNRVDQTGGLLLPMDLVRCISNWLCKQRTA